MLAVHELKAGRGAPLVFLHGFLGTSNDWTAVCSYLPAGRLCIGIDLPGHGNSRFTKSFFHEMPLFDAPIHLIGYSMGGRLAMQYQAQFPERIATMTLLSVHPGLKNEQEKKERLATDRRWAQRLLEDPWDLFLAAWYSQPIFGGFIPDLSLRKEPLREELALCLLFYSLACQEHLKPKGLYLVGEHDEKFHALHPDAIAIPNAAHAAHLENPQAVARTIARFLDV